MTSYVDLVGADLGTRTAWHEAAPFGCVSVTGPDAVGFVHRLCTQDVEGMVAGEARPAAFLNAKGKLETLAWVGRAAEGVWLEVQAHEVTKLAGLLERYHFSEKLRIAPLAEQGCVQLVGPNAWDAAGGVGPELVAGADVLMFAGEARGLRWLRWHRGAPPVPPSAPRWDAATWDVLRIAAGLPVVGRDADATHLGLELAIDDHVSLTKGCYTGQEIVARIHTYGHTNRRLCRVRWQAQAELPVGTQLADDDGEVVGRLTSVAVLSAGHGLGLTMLPRALAEPGRQLRAAGANTNAGAIVVVC
jgi:hypothetical protein